MHQLHTPDTQGASLISQVLRIHGNVHGMKPPTKDSKAEIQSQKKANSGIQIFFVVLLLSEKILLHEISKNIFVFDWTCNFFSGYIWPSLSVICTPSRGTFALSHLSKSLACLPREISKFSSHWHNQLIWKKKLLKCCNNVSWDWVTPCRSRRKKNISLVVAIGVNSAVIIHTSVWNVRSSSLPDREKKQTKNWNQMLIVISWGVNTPRFIYY